MREVKYYCNLCRELTQRVDLVCLYYNSESKSFEIVANLTKSDMHICKHCIKTIKNSKLINQQY